MLSRLLPKRGNFRRLDARGSIVRLWQVGREHRGADGERVPNAKDDLGVKIRVTPSFYSLN